MTARRFLILHGWENRRPETHWQYWLAGRLRDRGEQVLYPQLPSPDEPALGEWLRVLRAELRMLGHGERVVICHSLACLLWLRHAARATPAEAVDRLLLVCPPGPSALPPALDAFRMRPGDRTALLRSVRARPQLVCTDDDPWCADVPAAELYGCRLGMLVHVVAGAGHIAVDDGFGPWPLAERWALTGMPAGVRAAPTTV